MERAQDKVRQTRYTGLIDCAIRRVNLWRERMLAHRHRPEYECRWREERLALAALLWLSRVHRWN